MLDIEVFEMSDEMKFTYLSRRIDELNSFKRMNDSEKIVFAQNIGHKIAGSAQSFGFLELEPIAREMESLKSHDIDKCRRLIDLFEASINRVLR